MISSVSAVFKELRYRTRLIGAGSGTPSPSLSTLDGPDNCFRRPARPVGVPNFRQDIAAENTSILLTKLDNDEAVRRKSL